MHRSLYPHLYREDASKMSKEIKKAASKLRYRQVQVWREKSKVTWFRNKMQSSSSSKAPQQPQRLRAIKKTCPDPVSALTASQLAIHDPTGARARLFDRANPECARVGDILLVRQRTGEPFAGVCINVRRRGIDTAILLRGQLTRVGVEMWYKVYSPLVEGIEVVQRAQRKARRARLTYMRKEKHDRGNVENVVRVYLRQKAALGSAEGGKKKGAAAAAAAAGGKKKGNKRGKKR
ncbi:hypothetical protein BU23DRAFT_542821 [Bimuria novae-zelandiae CBS 107.79]|uniref:Mitochondrial ribosomal protein-like protein n=1 Tax=Bimuria novae-zelandiae CBS 107.79 TaxID=1447943 RepID=A0A6A5US62_9PLEO|nr:hypothetical protein BU23DRAFT_542821 [Bimuria novae-zelandiae CBS 107.79]